jgi:hypothetical protein
VRREVIGIVKLSRSQLLNIVLVTVLATSMLFMNTRSTIETKTASAGTYDPWLDYNEDGFIGIDDIFSTASNFGAEGDPTRNVTVTNWPTKRTLNASLADNLVIEGYPYYLEANVEGYSKVTLVMRMETSSGSLAVRIYLKIGGVLTPPIFTNYTLTQGTYFLLQSYEVIGPTIEIELDPAGQIRVWMGIYASD